MDLRNLPESLSSHERCAARRMKIQDTLGVNLSLLGTEPDRIGSAEEKNCEQMFGSVPIPVGYAGPLSVTFSDGTESEVHLPLATTEGALVASVNRGCKVLSACGGVKLSSIYHGISRSIALKTDDKESLLQFLTEKEAEWKRIGEHTSSHLKLLDHHIDTDGDYVFLTINGDTDEAMGMNMITIAADAIGRWVVDAFSRDARSRVSTELITIAANIDSDKKPSKRTHDLGRGYDVTASCTLNEDIVKDLLKTTPETLREVADAKLNHGSKLAGALGSNLHAANIIAALYLATGQDAAHVVEGSLADTRFDNLTIVTRCPALLVGVRGGGTELPAQRQCLDLLRKSASQALAPTQALAESIAAAVLAGEISLLAAQATQTLASSHKKLAR